MTDLLEPLTDTGDPFPDLEVDTAILRARVGALDPAAQQQALTVWQAAGLPAARDAEGNSVRLPAAQHRQISEIVRGQEQRATEAARGHALGLLAALSAGERTSVALSCRSHAIENPSSLLLTEGEATVVGLLVEAAFNARDDDEQPVGVELPPLDDRPGRVVPDAVADEAELDLIPPKGTIDDIMSWVGGDPAKAQAALEAEHAGKKRKGLISKLTPLVPAGPTPAPGGDGEVVQTGPLECYDHEVPPAPADRDPECEQLDDAAGVPVDQRVPDTAPTDQPTPASDENGEANEVDPEPAEPGDPDPEPEPRPAEQGDVLVTLEHLQGALGTVQTLLDALTHQISNNRGASPTDHTSA